MKKIIALAVFLTLTGCSNSFSESNLRKATARSIGLQEHEFIIGNRKNGVSTIEYDVKNKNNGEIYHCSTVFAPISGGVTTSPSCVDKFGSAIEPVTDKVTF